MAKLPLLSANEIVKILKKMGFELKRQRGSHMFFAHLDEFSRITRVQQ